MRNLTAAAVGLVLAVSSLQAEVLKNLKINGEIEIQMISLDNGFDLDNSTNDYTGQALTRVLLGADFDLLDDVSARVTLAKNNRVWGDSRSTGPSGGNNPGTESLDGLTANIGVDEAYFKIEDLMETFNLTLGRQYYGKQGDPEIYFGPSRIMSSLGLPTRSLDIAKVEYSGDMLNVTGIAGKIEDSGGTGPNTDADVDIQGAELAFKGLPVDLELYAYRTRERDPDNPGFGDGAENYHPGLRLKGEKDDLFFSLFFAKNFGTDQLGSSSPPFNTPAAPKKKNVGWGVLANAGIKLNMEGLAMIKPSAEYAYGTGDDPNTTDHEGFLAINPDYRPGEIAGLLTPGLFGGGDTDGINNLNMWNLGADVTPESLPKLTFTARYYNLRQNEQPIGTTEGKNLGQEWDLKASWAHSENVSLRLVWAQFNPGTAFGGGSSTDVITLYRSDVVVRF